MVNDNPRRFLTEPVKPFLAQHQHQGRSFADVGEIIVQRQGRVFIHISAEGRLAYQIARYLGLLHSGHDVILDEVLELSVSAWCYVDRVYHGVFRLMRADSDDSSRKLAQLQRSTIQTFSQSMTSALTRVRLTPATVVLNWTADLKRN